MRPTGLRIVTAVLLACLSITAAAANPPVIGPQATAAQIAIAHPGTQSATRLVFAKQTSGAPTTVVTAVVAAIVVLAGLSARVGALPAGDPYQALSEINHWVESVAAAEGFKHDERANLILLLDESGQVPARKLLRE